MSIKKTIAIAAISFFTSMNPSSASPWASPGDQLLRNDVEILAQYGLVIGPVNNWPMSWKQITGNFYKADSMELPAYVSRALERVREKIPAKINVKAKAYYTNEVDYFRGFEKTSRAEVEVEATTEINLETTSLHLNARYNDNKDFNLDGSYISQELGNVSIYAGAVDRWWGPGRETTTLMSTNARPMPSIGVRRVQAKPFKTKYLSWLGPWSGEIFVSKMDNNRHIPKPAFVGMKLSFEPVRNFEVGLARSLMLCGEGRVCNFKSWTHSLIAVGDLDNFGDTQEDVRNQPGNQLAMLDLSYSFSLKENINVKLYAEGTAEDIVVVAPYTYSRIIGASFYGAVGNDGGQYRVTAEYSDTTGSLVWFFGEHRKGVMYNHFIYLDGYRYYDKVIGHTLDSNSQYYSLKATLTQANGWQFSVKYQNIHINTENNFKNHLSASRERINSLSFDVSALTEIGNVRLGAKIADNDINTPLENKVNVRAGLTWEISF